MELDRVSWQRAATRVQRVALVARLLWLVAVLGPPLVALVAFRELLLPALLVALASLVLVRPAVFGLGAGGVVSSWRERISADGPDLTRVQVTQLLHDGMAQGEGVMWVTLHEGSQVRLMAEGRPPGAPARSSSPWVWAMGGGGM